MATPSDKTGASWTGKERPRIRKFQDRPCQNLRHAAQDVCGVINVGAVGVIGHGGRAY